MNVSLSHMLSSGRQDERSPFLYFICKTYVNIFNLYFYIHLIEFRIPGCWIVKTDQPGWHCCKGELTRAGLRFEKAVSRTWAQFPMKINWKPWRRETWGRRTCTSRWQEGSSRWREPIGGCRTWCCRSAEGALCTSAPRTWTISAQISGDYLQDPSWKTWQCVTPNAISVGFNLSFTWLVEPLHHAQPILGSFPAWVRIR